MLAARPIDEDIAESICLEAERFDRQTLAAPLPAAPPNDFVVWQQVWRKMRLRSLHGFPLWEEEVHGLLQRAFPTLRKIFLQYLGAAHMLQDERPPAPRRALPARSPTGTPTRSASSSVAGTPLGRAEDALAHPLPLQRRPSLPGSEGGDLQQLAAALSHPGGGTGVPAGEIFTAPKGAPPPGPPVSVAPPPPKGKEAKPLTEAAARTARREASPGAISFTAS